MAIRHPLRALMLLVVVSSAACLNTDNPLICSGTECVTVDPQGGGDGGGVTGGRGGGPCTESWVCSAWQPAGNNTATRICDDANACGTTATKPTEGPVALPSLNLAYFKCYVQPAFARSCSMLGCHGTLLTDRPFRVLARGRQRNAELVNFNPASVGCSGATAVVDLSVNATGTASCPSKIPLTNTEWTLNFDVARAFAIDSASSPATSELLLQPLRGSAFAHAGMKPWSATSSEYVTILNWLSGATLSTTCPAPNVN